MKNDESSSRAALSSCYLQWIGFELVVSGVLVGFCVVEDFVTVNGPFACYPLVELLIEDSFFGKLVGDVMWSGDLIRGLLRANVVLDVLVIWVSGGSSKCSHLLREEQGRSLLILDKLKRCVLHY